MGKNLGDIGGLDETSFKLQNYNGHQIKVLNLFLIEFGDIDHWFFEHRDWPNERSYAERFDKIWRLGLRGENNQRFTIDQIYKRVILSQEAYTTETEQLSRKKEEYRRRKET